MTNTSNKKKKKRGVSIKACIVMLAVVMLLGCAIGSTVAWLTAQTSEVTNTFTYGDINIELWETKDGKHTDLSAKNRTDKREGLKIIPGVDIPKDPTVTVKAGSEACWLFVKVEATGTFVNGKVEYSIDTSTPDGWKALEGQTGVYYREVASVAEDTNFNILTNNVVKVSDELTKDDINGIEAGKKSPSLTFTAYAVQKDGIADAAAAWAKVDPKSN